MKAYIRDHWAALLESGRYKQAKHRLCRLNEHGEYSFCCLGILVEMHQSAHREETGEALYSEVSCSSLGEAGTIGYDHNNSAINPHMKFPPARTRSWAGLSYGEEKRLARLNDQGRSFREIAKVIRSLPVGKETS